MTEYFDIFAYLMGQTDKGPPAGNGSLIPYLMGKAEANIVERTASGAVAHITDAIAAPFKGVTAQITPVQSGSGDPSPDNVRPISGWTGVTIKRTGRNLLEISSSTLAKPSFYSGTWDGTSAGESPGSIIVTRSSGIGGAGGICLGPLKAGTYHLTGNCPKTQAAKPAFHGLVVNGVYGGQKSFQSIASSSTSIDRVLTLTSDISDGFVKLQATSDNTPIEFTNLQLTRASAPSDFVSYTGSSVSITFPNDPGTVYGGTLSIAEDGSATLTVTMVEVDLGDLSWGAHATAASVYQATRPSSMPAWHRIEAGGSAYALCSRYVLTTSAAGGVVDLDNSIALGTGGSDKIYIHDSSVADASELQTAVDGTQLVYELAAPQTYTLTPVTPITTLAGENNVWADSGDVSVTYLADGRASNQLAVSMLLGRNYLHNPNDPDDATAAEALTILTGGDTR